MRAARAEHAVREATRRTSKWKGLGAFFVRTGAARMSICLGQDLHAKRSADEAQRNVNGSVLTVEEGQEKSVPFWQQGDLDMYTEANLAKRYKLRHSPEVLEVLQMWWACAQRSMQSEKLQGTALARDDYVRICTKIYKAMIDNFDEAEALMTAAGSAGVTLQSVGRFAGDSVKFGTSEAPLSELSALYRGRFGELFG